MLFGLKKTGQDIKIEFLKSIPIFSNLKKTELIKLDMIIHEREYNGGETIFYENEPGTSLYIVKTGKVELLKNVDEKEKIITIFKKGDFFGEIAVLIDSPRTSTARAFEKTTLIALSRPDLLNLIERNPKLGSKILFEISKVIATRFSMVVEN